jgi:uncharacterized protein
MNFTTAILLGVAMGCVFGVALEKSRVFEPGTIVSQMQLRTFLMLKIFLSAVVTGLVVLAVLNGVLGVKMYPKALVWQADAIGGLLLGAGISIAGACPGSRSRAGLSVLWCSAIWSLCCAPFCSVVGPASQRTINSRMFPSGCWHSW